MRSHRYILASSALALIVAVPYGIVKDKPAAAPMTAISAEPVAQTAPAGPANEPPAVADSAPLDPAIAAEPAAAPDPLALLDPADRVIAEKIRDLLATKADRIFAGKKERAAAEAFYQNRNLVPLWLEKGVENPRAGSVIARLNKADTDGLEPRITSRRILPVLIRMPWPKPSSSSLTRCSPMHGTCRPGGFLTAA